MTPPLSVVPESAPQVIEVEAPAQLETAVSVRNLPLGVLAILASLFTLHWAAPVLVPIMLAMTANYALAPLVDRMQRWGLPRALAAALVLGALVSVLGVSAYRLRDDATTVIESLPNIKVPSVVIVGSKDTPFIAASDYMAAKIPGAQKIVIDDAGHASNIDQPKAFNDALVAYLEKLPAA